MRLKNGVTSHGISGPMILALIIIEGIFRSYNVDCVVTSICDGKHGKGSYHRFGLAADIRTRGLTSRDLGDLVAEITEALPGYDVVVEPDHLHVEYDPKQGE